MIEAPEPRAPRKPSPATTGKRKGRAPAIAEDVARALHKRYVAGEALADLAGKAGLGSGGALWARFKALGLPTGWKAKVAANAEAPVRRLAPGESRASDYKGAPLK